MNRDHYEFNDKKICPDCKYVEGSFGCDEQCGEIMSKFTEFDQKYEKEAKIADNETLFSFKSAEVSTDFENWLDEEGWEKFGEYLEKKGE